jgi:hypothetical protein
MVARWRTKWLALAPIMEVLTTCMIVRVDLILTKVPCYADVVPARSRRPPGRWWTATAAAAGCLRLPPPGEAIVDDRRAPRNDPFGFGP